MEFSQATRELRVETDLGPDVLLMKGFSGTESISTPFMFQVDMISEQPFDTAALLRTPMALVVTLEDGSERKIHGKISRVVELGQVDGIASYRAEMVPWFWFMGLNRESRIFQQMTVPEIVEQVFADRGQADYEMHCPGPYPTVEFCVQYRESDLAFVQRLLEREGIFYFFRHDDDKEVMVIADHAVFQPSPHKPVVPFNAEEHVDEEVISSFQRERAVHVGTVTLRDYDPLQPTLDMSASLSGEEQQEYYDYPGAYAKLFCNDPGDVAGEGDRYARLRLELEESRRYRARGQGNCRGLLVGFQFELISALPPEADGAYVITAISHVASGTGYRSAGGGGTDYQCSFAVVDAEQTYRPPLRTVRPVVEGTQTAVVVGPAGEEVWTDSHGRVKCQFHWDREGQNDENSSCWIRVATPWGGKGYGSISIPRIGNEVVIDFLEGDPDQPLIVGSVYNADQTPPFALPDSDIQMGMKSRSSKGGGGYNEITVTDTKGDEKVTIHAEKNRSETVKNNATQSVGVNRTSSVGHDDTLSVGHNQKLTVDCDQEGLIKGSRTHTVAINSAETIGVAKELTIGGLYQITVGGLMNETVVGAKTEEVGAYRMETVALRRETNVGGNWILAVGGDREESVEGSASLSVAGDANVGIGGEANLRVDGEANISADGNLSVKTKADLAMSADGKAELSAPQITLSAGTKLTLKCGGSTIELTPGDITIKGPLVKINS